MGTGIEVKKRPGESASSLLYNFTKKIKRSGILKEARKRRFYKRRVSRLKRRLSAIHRESKKKEIETARKLGIL
jgi:ribosomal protein S21